MSAKQFDVTVSFGGETLRVTGTLEIEMIHREIIIDKVYLMPYNHDITTLYDVIYKSDSKSLLRDVVKELNNLSNTII